VESRTGKEGGGDGDGETSWSTSSVVSGTAASRRDDVDEERSPCSLLDGESLLS